ncbi:MAG: Pnap_2097 family protein [Hansschlegelia sp.]
MTIAVDPARLKAEAVRPPRRSTGFLLGMPELCLGGLSETWLLKECGGLHWRLIADLAGKDRPEFRDETGAKVYAAFCAASAEGLGLDAFEEHDQLELISELAQASRTRIASRHVLMKNGVAKGAVELLSTFVRREQTGRNRSIARVTLPEIPDAAQGADLSVLRLSALLRGRDWKTHRGFAREQEASGPSAIFRPCPSQDFNGAGLLYCASYQAFADRAEWELLDLSGTATRSRDIAFHGNIEPGERIRLTLRGVSRERKSVTHWLAVESAEDGRPLADIFTTREQAA